MSAYIYTNYSMGRAHERGTIDATSYGEAVRLVEKLNLPHRALPGTHRMAASKGRVIGIKRA